MSSSDSCRPQIVYKILTQSQWKSWIDSPKVSIPGSQFKAHLFTGAGIDIKDGYIHLSTAEQGLGTYTKWFAKGNPAEETSELADVEKSGGEPLVLVEIDLKKVAGAVKWELAPSRGEEFAHVYDGGIPFVRKDDDSEGISAVLRFWEDKDVRTKLFEDIVAEKKG